MRDPDWYKRQAVAVIAKKKGIPMTAIETGPELDIHSTPETGLVVEPSDITFEDLTRDTVVICVRIRNEGAHRSSQTFITLQSALFGAFVPWRPLARLRVPALQPGQSTVVSVQAERPHPKALGDFDRIPPGKVVTALDASPEEPSAGRRNRYGEVVARIMGKKETARPAITSTVVTTRALLPPDLWELFGREQPHWAGNINVFVGDRAVERHRAKSLRIYAGRTNLAMFIVGGQRKRDAYAFEIVGLALDWKAALHSAMSRETLVIRASDIAVEEKKWVESAGFMPMILAVRPPIVCEEGKVQVHVTRRSCGTTAVVEFDLDPTAQGPGCYVA